MITTNFHPDGAYIKGHDSNEVCTLVSYAMWACMNDCYREDTNIVFYESINDEEWKSLGFTYIKIDESVEGHVKILDRFKLNLTYWIEVLFPNRIFIINHDGLINWESALNDAKQYHVA